MADDEGYIMPYTDVSELKKHVKRMEGKGDVNPGQLFNSMNSLTKSMDSMLELFKTAAEEMKLEEQEEKVLAHEMKPLMDKLDEIIEQNKIIAEGMIALSDLVKERLPDKQEERIMPQQNVFPRPKQGMSPQGMPPTGMGPGIPPPPGGMRGPSMQQRMPPPPNIPLDLSNMPPPPPMPD